MPTLNIKKLANAVADALCISRDNNAHGVHWIAASAVIKTIIAGLQRGEEVRVNGFGRFKFRTVKSHICTCSHLGPDKVFKFRVPKKRYVYFTPSRYLKRMLYEPYSQM